MLFWALILYMSIGLLLLLALTKKVSLSKAVVILGLCLWPLLLIAAFRPFWFIRLDWIPFETAMGLVVGGRKTAYVILEKDGRHTLLRCIRVEKGLWVCPVRASQNVAQLQKLTNQTWLLNTLIKSPEEMIESVSGQSGWEFIEF